MFSRFDLFLFFFWYPLIAFGGFSLGDHFADALREASWGVKGLLIYAYFLIWFAPLLWHTSRNHKRALLNLRAVQAPAAAPAQTARQYVVRRHGASFGVMRVITGVEVQRPHTVGLTESEAQALAKALNNEVQQSRNP